MLSFLNSVLSFSKPELNFQKIKMSRILLADALSYPIYPNYGKIWLQYIYIYNYIMCIYGGYQKLWYPKTALTPRFREPFAPFRAPAESGHGIMIRFSCANSSQRFTGGLYLKTLLIGDPFSKLL